ncbi:NADH dehydrogenase [ubiquinone] 1 beta subcomplex subunit 11, mitochondrial-like [Liolophura sinensis]|uniref:NADH dehydrogenase [ubiquinone] 1 beta subcomplex subunit 11, mitochondrial-like n=1 Tax=Liolophura sinensis TaxID=3198878 RepID=UPI00315869E2
MAASLLKFVRLARQSSVIASPWRERTRLTRTITPACMISTSKKNKDSVSTVEPIQSPKTDTERPEDMFPADPYHEKNWISYGYDLVDKEDDRFFHRVTMFLFISLGLCLTTFVIAYMPDNKLDQWSHREAYLELARREKDGLPLIDCELIDPSTIELPSDEELGDTEIII